MKPCLYDMAYGCVCVIVRLCIIIVMYICSTQSVYVTFVIGFVSYLFVIAPLLFLNCLLFGSLIKIFFWYSKTTCGIDLYMFHFSMPPRKEPPPPPPPTVEALLALLMEDRQATRAESAVTIAALQ